MQRYISQICIYTKILLTGHKRYLVFYYIIWLNNAYEIKLEKLYSYPLFFLVWISVNNSTVFQLSFIVCVNYLFCGLNSLQLLLFCFTYKIIRFSSWSGLVRKKKSSLLNVYAPWLLVERNPTTDVRKHNNTNTVCSRHKSQTPEPYKYSLRVLIKTYDRNCKGQLL